jgi:hypothetical protein
LIIIIIIIVCLLRYVFDVIKPPKKNTPKTPTPEPDIVLVKNEGKTDSKMLQNYKHQEYKIDSDEFTISFWYKAIIGFPNDWNDENGDPYIYMHNNNIIYINNKPFELDIENSTANSTDGFVEYDMNEPYTSHFSVDEYDKFDNQLILVNFDCFLKIPFYIGDNNIREPQLYVEMKNKESDGNPNTQYKRIYMNDVMKSHDNKYNFYVVQYKRMTNGSYSILTYINGKLSQTSNNNLKLPENSYLHHSSNRYYYFGECDNLYYYKKVLTESHIKKLYETSRPIPRPITPVNNEPINGEAFETIKPSIGSNYKNDSNNIESDKSNKLFPFIVDLIIY